ncbi:MAG: right-handed parallel beta-helix repeat-containing protein [Gemmatimonadaceae bacterium]
MHESQRAPKAPWSPLSLLLLIPLLASCATNEQSPLAPDDLSRASVSSPGRHVAPTGHDVGDCSDSPCLTINYAISQAAAGDRILVAAGTYLESVSVTKQLLLTGHGATIDAAGQSSPPNAIVISGTGAAGTVVTGFTIQNAGLEGIFVNKTSKIRIENNVVVNNDAYGPFHPLCAAQPDDCGEAIHLQSVTNSIVKGNSVHDNIGGILLTDEDGPTSDNRITENLVFNNTLDCGITLASHWFSLTGPAAPDVAGVYHNLVSHNTARGNGAAGIGVFAGPPGAAAWENLVSYNEALNNGFAGIEIHSHTPGQNANGNVITHNTLSGNGIDDDNPVDDARAGISVFSAVIPIPHTTISFNSITNEYYGIITLNAAQLTGIASNKFSPSVVVPISIH